jgi:glycosyltransferase involved in cell wall biosynthesis
MPDKFEVDIVLATFNGQDFLEQLLASLEAQVGVELNLIVGDDGSSDSTLSILNRYSDSFKSMQVIQFRRLGPSRNFLTLLEFSKADFIAFADQDDIWDSQKTLTLVHAIKSETGPVLAFGEIVPLPVSFRAPITNSSLPGLIHRNTIRGCSILFNGSLRDHILDLDKDLLLMHDWGSVLLCRVIGKVIPVSNATTVYRIHKGNAVGIPSLGNRFFQSLRGTLNRQFPKGIYLQAQEILRHSEKQPKSIEFEKVQEWHEAVTSDLLERVSYSIRMMISHDLRLSDVTRICLGFFKFSKFNR